MKITTKIFGETIYSQEDGLTFDTETISFNGITNPCSGMIFEGLNSKQIEASEYLINSLELLDKKAREIFLEIYAKEAEMVAPFVNEHFNDYGDEVREMIFKKLQITHQDDKAFLENMEFGSFYISEDDTTNGAEITMDYNLI